MADELVKPSEWLKLIEYALNAVFGPEAPKFISWIIGAILLVAILFAIVVAILIAAGKIKDIWIEKFRPLAYSPEEKKRSREKRLFANHVLRELNQRNLSENWKDEEFAELEAEIEAEGLKRDRFPIFNTFRTQGGLRREPSLTKALERSAERLILLEGDPGSGKSVALRHVAQVIAERTSKTRHAHATLPIYVNLKELKRKDTEEVNRELIRAFILQTLNRVNDRFIDQFLDEEFDAGIQRGSWIFLFDSFDEIPDVLSSTEGDARVHEYSQAIADFLGGMNSCRGIIASRFYRGPSQMGWRKFRILDLSPERQQELIDKAILKVDAADKLKGELAIASDDIQSMGRNPMLLGLLCEHMRLGNEFPTLAYEVFDKYLRFRFNRDADRVLQRFNLQVAELRTNAEEIAFAIANNPRLGLSPTRRLLIGVLTTTGARSKAKRLTRIFDALEYMKIGRADYGGSQQDDRQFTFAHRRFQEYFATCIVIRNPDIVSARRLLLDARWRETAVVLCQTGTPSQIDPLIVEAKRKINDARDNLPMERGTGNFIWPSGILHVLDILQAGFGTNRQVPRDLADAAAQILKAATDQGNMLDRKFALEVAGVTPQDTVTELVRGALGADSAWLTDVVFRQIGRLFVVPTDVWQWVCNAIVRMALGSGANRRKDSIFAYVCRLPRSTVLIDVLRLSLWIKPIDAVALGICIVTVWILMKQPIDWPIIGAFGLVYVLHVVYWRHYYLGLMTTVRVGFNMMFTVFTFFLAWIWSSFGLALLLGFGILYLSNWSLIAAFAAKRGQFVHLYLWPFAFVELFKQAYYDHRSVLRSVLPIIQWVVLMSLYWAVTYISPYKVPAMPAPVFLVAFGVIAMVYAGIMILLGWRLMSDYWLFLEVKANYKNAPVEIVCRQYEKFTTGLFKYKYLNYARVNGIVFSSDQEETLRGLVQRVETDSQPTKLTTSSIMMPIQRTLVDLLMFDVDYHRDRQDEVYRLAEDFLRSSNLITDGRHKSASISVI